MNILNNISSLPSSAESVKRSNTTPVIKTENKKDILDIFNEKVANRKDITDTVTMPRAIFKGYLCFTAGTAINAMAAIIKHEKVKGAMQIIGSAIAILGTFNFVKPFLANSRVQKLTENKK